MLILLANDEHMLNTCRCQKFNSNHCPKAMILLDSIPSNLYENMPIQIYWKFYHQKMKIFR